MFAPEPTLTHFTRQWEERMELLHNALSSPKTPARNLQPIDVYLLNELVRRMPKRPVVIDLAADFTNGASSLCFSLDTAPSLLACPRYPWPNGTSDEWREAYRRLTAAGSLQPLSTEGGDVKEALLSPRASVAPVCFTMAPNEKDADKLGSYLKELFSLRLNASVWILHVGRLDECPVLREVQRFCMSGEGTYRTVLAREYSPFLHGSGLCIIEPVGFQSMVNSLHRLSALLDGNFGFLDMAERLSESEMKNSEEMNAFYNPAPRQGGSAMQGVRRFFRRLLKG